ncbi:MAG: TIGR04211 family SH3 domain-containing protein [Marinagarivorans sp.]|nr:TIGR04211 family SH3 domain-containing protein [Marinagarivorans sp.]
MIQITKALPLALALLGSIAHADTRTVTDKQLVTLRSGAGNEFRIINSRIPTGAKVTVQEEPNGDWIKVRIANGTQGWMRKQDLQKDPTAQELLDNAEKKQAAAEAQLGEVSQAFNELKAKHNELEQITGRAQKQQEDLVTNYQNLKMLSEDAVQLNERYQRLLAEHEVLLTKHDALKAENDNMHKDQRISHGLYAVALLIGGMILAVILPSLRRRKRYSDQIL